MYDSSSSSGVTKQKQGNNIWGKSLGKKNKERKVCDFGSFHFGDLKQLATEDGHVLRSITSFISRSMSQLRPSKFSL